MQIGSNILLSRVLLIENVLVEFVRKNIDCHYVNCFSRQPCATQSNSKDMNWYVQHQKQLIIQLYTFFIIMYHYKVVNVLF